MFPMTVTITTPAQLNAVMAALGVPEAPPAPVAAEAKPAKAKKEPAQATVAPNGASSTPDKASPPPADAAAQEPAAENAPTPSAAASVSYEDVKKAIIKLSQAKGRDAVVATLAQFDAATGPALKPEQYAGFVAAADAAIAED